MSKVLALFANRFQLSVSWINQHATPPTTGDGVPIPENDHCGKFGFFDGINFDLVVKIVDGFAINGKFWIFYASLSDVEFTLTVTDTKTGAVKSYHGDPGVLAVGKDQEFFISDGSVPAPPPPPTPAPCVPLPATKWTTDGSSWFIKDSCGNTLAADKDGNPLPAPGPVPPPGPGPTPDPDHAGFRLVGDWVNDPAKVKIIGTGTAARLDFSTLSPGWQTWGNAYLSGGALDDFTKIGNVFNQQGLQIAAGDVGFAGRDPVTGATVKVPATGNEATFTCWVRVV